MWEYEASREAEKANVAASIGQVANRQARVVAAGGVANEVEHRCRDGGNGSAAGHVVPRALCARHAPDRFVRRSPTTARGVVRVGTTPLEIMMQMVRYFSYANACSSNHSVNNRVNSSSS